MFVFRTFLFVLIFKCLVTSVYSESQLASNNNNSAVNDIAKLNGTDVVKNVNLTKASQSNETAPTIVGEGGEKLPTKAEDVKSTTERSDIDMKLTSSTVTRTYGREGEFLEVPKENNTAINVTKENNGNVTTSTEISKPVSENPTAEKPVTEKAVTLDADTPTTKSRSRIVPKKGVDFDETITPKPVVAPSTVAAITQSTTTTTTTTLAPTTAVKKIPKPTVTTGSEDDKDALVKQKSNNDSTPKVPTIEYYQKTKEDNKRSAFIIPIVAVILSVPMVAIVLNILYKRCKEWWTHRHYSRMDFLIDGMYNN